MWSPLQITWLWPHLFLQLFVCKNSFLFYFHFCLYYIYVIILMSELREWFLPDIVGRLHQPKGLSEAKDCQYQTFSCFFFFFQILFLSCIFGYLVILIVYKWIAIDINSKNVSYWCHPWCHTWAEFLVGYHPCFKGFSAGSSGFPPSTKNPNIPNSNST